MLMHKTIRKIGTTEDGTLFSNDFRDVGFEKFEDYREALRHKSLKLNELVRADRLDELYDYVFGVTDENPMDSIQL